MGAAISSGRQIFRKSTFFWMLLVSVVVTLETLVHERLSGTEFGDRLEHGALLFTAVFLLSFHYESLKLTPRLLKGSAILMAVTFLVSWLTSLQVVLCIEILFVALFLRILNRHLFVCSRFMVFGIAIFFVYEALVLAEHDRLEILIGLFLVELTFRVVVALDLRGPKAFPKKRAGFELQNVLSVALGGKRNFWEETFQNGEWEFLDSPAQSPRHILIAGMVNQGMANPVELLDVGCGHGTLLAFLSPNVNYIGLDVSETVTVANRERHEGRATFVAADLFSYAPEGKKFDVIVLNEVLYYVPIRSALRAVRHCAGLLLSDDSRLIISMNKNPKAILLWEMLNYSIPSESVLSIENHHSGSKWYLRSFTKSSIQGTTALKS